MTVKELLEAKGKDVVSIASGNSVEDAIRSMNARHIGSLVVTEDGKPVGIFTERDIVRCYVNTNGSPFNSVRLKDAMTSDLIVAEPDEELCDVMSVMIQKGIRHLPVSGNGKVVGMLSIGDVVQSQIGNLHAEIHHLKDYIIS
ncbi:MAG: CBS domain-containing protein [Nitrospiraceae bacterium]|nr:CBS domain-containing protein [Nitrospiraceae bacterium]